MTPYNIFKNLEFSPDREIEEIIFENEKISLVRISSLDQATAYYDQDDLEIVKIERGSASLEIEGEIVDLKEGDILPINPHQVHRVLRQDRAVWLCIFVK
ncbi:AraC family ligand binding domain-containing protein [uncultured Anaerococcus sp.]|uniref:AraC family ligand binding domain-containing protein n=1 Tax=uncultured Anaerococcus sp. TaxID=293428 RepID=UPI0025EF45C8|nr:AraC family ligand binding domain-containing protein [uncultured Anaerococcus sp.]